MILNKKGIVLECALHMEDPGSIGVPQMLTINWQNANKDAKQNFISNKMATSKKVDCFLKIMFQSAQLHKKVCMKKIENKAPFSKEYVFPLHSGITPEMGSLGGV